MFRITLPKAGGSMEDGTIICWHVREGQAVQKGQTLVEVEADTASIEIESASAGTLRKILHPQGDTVPVNTVLAICASDGEDIAAAVAEAKKSNEALAAAYQAGTLECGGNAAAFTSLSQQPEVKAGPMAPQSKAPAPSGNVIPVLMPQVGNSMEEGTIIKWHVKPGDRIKQGDIIFDVETDKATIEVEATDTGRLAKIVVQEDETMKVKKPVAFLAENDADVSAYLAAGGERPALECGGIAAALTPVPHLPEVKAGPMAPQSKGPSSAASARGVVVSVVARPKASPAARKLASERGLNLATIASGSGPGGRILSSDLAAAVAAPGPAAPVTPAQVVVGEPVRRRMSGMRKAIARNLQASKQNIPHFYIQITLDAEPMMSFYRSQKAQYQCTVNDVIVSACAKAISEFPAFRSRIDAEKNEIIEFSTANIGIAVGMDDGLVVPVVVGAEQMSLAQLGLETKRLIENARGGKIENMGQGVFTITNLGMFGIEQFSAIINPPEAAILAVGAVRETVIVREGAMRPGKVVTLSLSADHRVVDGLLAAKYLNRLKEILETPGQLA